MRTTIRMDDALLREAKALAEKHGYTFTQVVERGVRLWIRETKASRPARAPFDPPRSDAWSAPMTNDEFLEMVRRMDEEDDMRRLGIVTDGPEGSGTR